MITEIIIGIIGLLCLVGTVWGYIKGKKDADTAHEVQDFNEYVETRKRMESADHGTDVDKWLRERAKRDGTL